MKNNFISLITEKILNEISNEGELSKEISEYKKNSAKIDELKKSIESVLKQIKSGEDEEKKRLALIVKFMQDFNVKKAEGDDWVAELEQIPAFKYPSASYKELWEEAMSKLNEATKKVLKGFENAQLDAKRKQTKPELTIKGKDLKENSNENLTLEDIINLPKDAVVVGGGYKYVKIGKNAWKSTKGVLKDDKHLFEFLNGFDDFGYYFKVLKENIISKGLDWLKGLLLSIKGYKKTVDNLPDLKKLNEESLKEVKTKELFFNNYTDRKVIEKYLKDNFIHYEFGNGVVEVPIEDYEEIKNELKKKGVILKEEDKGKIILKKDTKEDDIKKYTDKGINVEIEEIGHKIDQNRNQLKDILDTEQKLRWDGRIYLTKNWDNIYKIHDGGFVVFKSRNFDEIYDWLNSNQDNKLEEINNNDPVLVKLRKEKIEREKLRNQPKIKPLKDLDFSQENELINLLKQRNDLQLSIEQVADVKTGELNDDGELLALDKRISKIIKGKNLSQKIQNLINKATSSINTDISLFFSQDVALKEGYSGNNTSFKNQPKSLEDAIKVVKGWVSGDGDTFGNGNFEGVYDAGETTKEEMGELAKKYEAEKVIVGKVGDKFCYAYWKRD